MLGKGERAAREGRCTYCIRQSIDGREMKWTIANQLCARFVKFVSCICLDITWGQTSAWFRPFRYTLYNNSDIRQPTS